MAKKIYDLVAITGEYTNRNGEVKKRYMNCGVVFKNEETGNLSMKLEGLPVGDWNGWLSLYEPKEKAQVVPIAAKNVDPFASRGSDAPEDNIPF